MDAITIARCKAIPLAGLFQKGFFTEDNRTILDNMKAGDKDRFEAPVLLLELACNYRFRYRVNRRLKLIQSDPDKSVSMTPLCEQVRSRQASA